MKEELKPCPFCGGKAFYHENRIHFHVRCKTVSCHGRNCGLNFGNKANALTAWNQRTK